MVRNVTQKILELTKRKLLKNRNHPLAILSQSIQSYFDQTHPQLFNQILLDDPIVSTSANFDSLNIPIDHVSRQLSDTYYLDSNTVLRCHTSAHQVEYLKKGYQAFLLSGDVYRRDSIDATHFPAFHQMEGIRIWDKQQVTQEQVLDDLVSVLDGLSVHLFGDTKRRWLDVYFPFTHPSKELEIYFKEDWMEVLGCGVIHPFVMQQAAREQYTGWAFGLGLERLAMKLFEIPDIRLFWSQDERFLHQFSQEKGLTKFSPFSKYPGCYKDISFWLPEDFVENNFFELIREQAGDLVENVECIDQYTNKENKESRCYRITYRSLHRNLTNQEIDVLQFQLRNQLTTEGFEIR